MLEISEVVSAHLLQEQLPLTEVVWDGQRAVAQEAQHVAEEGAVAVEEVAAVLAAVGVAGEDRSKDGVVVKSAQGVTTRGVEHAADVEVNVTCPLPGDIHAQTMLNPRHCSRHQKKECRSAARGDGAVLCFLCGAVFVFQRMRKKKAEDVDECKKKYKERKCRT